MQKEHRSKYQYLRPQRWIKDPQGYVSGLPAIQVLFMGMGNIFRCAVTPALLKIFIGFFKKAIIFA